MSGTQDFVIRRSFLFPLGLLLALCLVLFATCLLQKEPTGKVMILGLIIVPVALLFLESVFRRATVGSDQITVAKFLRKKTLCLADVTALDAVQVRKRAFLTLSTEEDFLILSNGYAGFPQLLSELISRGPGPSVSEEARRMAAAPPRKNTDIVSCWLGVAVVALILFIQLGGRL